MYFVVSYYENAFICVKRKEKIQIKDEMRYKYNSSFYINPLNIIGIICSIVKPVRGHTSQQLLVGQSKKTFVHKICIYLPVIDHHKTASTIFIASPLTLFYQ